MYRRHFVALAATSSLAGCTGLLDSDESGRLDLTVHNEGGAPITVRVAVVDEEGTTYEDESDRIDSGVARAFEVAVGTEGRHEVTVSGDDFEGQLAWNADTCTRYEGTVRVTDDRLEVAGECADSG